MGAARREYSDSHEERTLRGLSIPPRPQLLLDIQKVDGDLRQIGDIISRDPALAAAVLRLANSPHMGFRQKLSAIGQAVALLGLNNVMSLVHGVSLQNALSGAHDLERFWALCTDTAMVAAATSRELKVGKRDEIFTLALFHNCGVAMLMQRYSNYLDLVQHCYADPTGNILALEHEAISTDHATIGYYVARSWHLPSHLIEAIRHHHTTKDIMAAGCDTALLDDLMVLKLAEHLSEVHRMLGKQDVDYEWVDINAIVLDYLGLSVDDFENLRDIIAQTVVYET